ncbi:MAG: CBS domain-containing protein, partial [Steroidobacteraceae bacterium]
GDLSARAALRDYFGTDQKHRAYPVVTERRLLGMLDRSMLYSLSGAALQQPVAQLLPALSAGGFVTPDGTCKAAAAQLAARGLERLPVVDDIHGRHIVGIVSRSDLVKPAHRIHEEEVRRERLLGEA